MDQLFNWARDVLLIAIVACVAVAPIALVAFLVRLRRGTVLDAAKSTALDALVVGSILLVVVYGLRPGWGQTDDWQQWTLVPFRDLMRSVGGPRLAMELALANVLGNFALYLPLGAALRLRFPNLRFKWVVAVVSCLSAAVEVGQAIEASGRTSDVTDVLMNTLGGVSGWLSMGVIGSRLKRDGGGSSRSGQDLAATQPTEH